MTQAQQWAGNLCDAMADELYGRAKPEIVGPYVKLASLMLTKSLWVADGTRRLLKALYDDGRDNLP